MTPNPILIVNPLTVKNRAVLKGLGFKGSRVLGTGVLGSRVLGFRV